MRGDEVACDESGSEGENLIGGETDVFTHASVGLTSEAAADCVREIRDRIRSPALEYKANHLLRAKNRSTLEWLLGMSGPIHGKARVHLTDKTFFLVGKAIDFLIAGISCSASIGRHQDPPARAMALTLYREGPRAFGQERWVAFLESFLGLVRAANRGGGGAPADSFFRLVDELRTGAPVRVREILERFRRARARAESLRAELLDRPKMIPALDPLMPAIVETVGYWSAGGRPVSLVHDEQAALTADRVAQLGEILGGRLAALRFVDSRADPRVQVADFLAGVARRIASDELRRQGDAELTALLRPHVGSFPVWGDDRSWSSP
ncbi:DUF3800 domain-containing protein [Amycolatopsis anabasis]|uniref:DUF3800 domain-containing protein n=1 Tax=Amycolatopsis anabasis TaxID=1840409 RepID=UPI00131ABCCD|nr:DUF3800 domain-containing protein [Amycolatopsis anabasis]